MNNNSCAPIARSQTLPGNHNSYPIPMVQEGGNVRPLRNGETIGNCYLDLAALVASVITALPPAPLPIPPIPDSYVDCKSTLIPVGAALATCADLSAAIAKIPADNFLKSASFVSPNLTLTLTNSTTVVVDLTALIDTDGYVDCGGNVIRPNSAIASCADLANATAGVVAQINATNANLATTNFNLAQTNQSVTNLYNNSLITNANVAAVTASAAATQNQLDAIKVADCQGNNIPLDGTVPLATCDDLANVTKRLTLNDCSGATIPLDGSVLVATCKDLETQLLGVKYFVADCAGNPVNSGDKILTPGSYSVRINGDAAQALVQAPNAVKVDIGIDSSNTTACAVVAKITATIPVLAKSRGCTGFIQDAEDILVINPLGQLRRKEFRYKPQNILSVMQQDSGTAFLPATNQVNLLPYDFAYTNNSACDTQLVEIEIDFGTAWFIAQNGTIDRARFVPKLGSSVVSAAAAQAARTSATANRMIAVNFGIVGQDYKSYVIGKRTVMYNTLPPGQTLFAGISYDLNTFGGIVGVNVQQRVLIFGVAVTTRIVNL